MADDEADGLPRWLFLDMNSYFASVEQQEQPALRGRPVIVVPMVTDSTCAIAASYEAKAFGIRTGTNVGEARALCRDLLVVPARHDLYVAYHERIVAAAEDCLHVTTVCSIDEVACALLGTEREPEAALALGRKVKAAIHKNVGAQMRCSVGLAPTRFLAKVASDLQKPDGLTLLHGRDLPGRLLGLELIDLPGIGRNMQRRLAAANVRTVADLWHLTPAAAREAWGSIEGERFWYQLHGVDLPAQVTERHSIGHSHVLAPVLRPHDLARLVARRLVAKAASRLRRLAYRAEALSLSARIEYGPRVTGEIRVEATGDSFVLLRALDRLWSKTVPPGRRVRVKKVAVVLHRLKADEAIRPDLFTWREGTAESTAGRRLSTAMDRLNRRYGRDTVTIGMMPHGLPTYTGTKVAFTRIPDMAEFVE